MRQTISLKVMMAAVLATATLVSGCTGAKSLTGSESPASAVKAAAKPPLVVPAAFANKQAKLDFGLKAVKDGYYKEARSILEQAVIASPDVYGFAALGTARFNQNDYSGAVESWTKAASLDPAIAGEMQNNIGNALRDAGKHVEAHAAYEKALKLEPTRWTAAVNLATMLKLDGNPSAAISVLESATIANKDVVPLVNFLNHLKSEAAVRGKTK